MAFVDVTSVISLYRITLQTSILNGISESGTPATYADMLLIIIIIININFVSRTVAVVPLYSLW